MFRIIKRLSLILVIVLTLTGCGNSEEDIDLPFYRYNHPVINNGNIYLCINNNINKNSIDKLISYNIKTKKQEVLYHSRYEEAAVQWTKVNDNWLVFVDSSSDGLNANIMAMNLKTREKRELAKTNPERYTVFAPELYNDYVAWVEVIQDKKIEVKLHDLKSNKTVSIANINNYGLFNAFASINDDKLVWSDVINNKGYYYMYDINSKETKNFPAPKQYPGYPIYSNNEIYSLNFDDYNQWSIQSFGYFDIKTQKYNQIDTKSSYLNGFDVYNDKIMIIDNNQKLRLYKLKNDKLESIVYKVKDNPNWGKFDQNGNLMLTYEDNYGNYKLSIIYK